MKVKYRYANIIIGLLGIISCSVSAITASLPAEIQKRGFFTVGVNCSYPPAGYVELDGSHAGYEIDIVKQIAKQAFGSDEAIKMQCVNDNNRISFIQSNKVDFVLASFAYTPARAEEIDFSDPVWVSNMQLIVPKDSPIQNFDDLKDKKIATIASSTYQTWFKTCYPDYDITTVKVGAEGTTILKQKRVDAFAYIDVYGFNFTKIQPDFRLAGPLAAPAMQGIGLKKGNDELRNWINEVLADMRQEDFFFNAFSKQVNNPEFEQKYRNIVPGPNINLDYSKSNALACFK